LLFFMSLNPKESNGRNIKCDLWKHFPPRRDSEPHVPTHMQNVVFVRTMRTAKRSDSLWWCHKKQLATKPSQIDINVMKNNQILAVRFFFHHLL